MDCDILVKNGRVVTAKGVDTADVAVKDGRVIALLAPSAQGSVRADQVLDAKGKFVLPGAIDVHAHLNDPGFTWREDFAHGTTAAAAGGVTTVVDMPLQNEPALTDADIFARKHEAVREKALVDYAFWGGLTGDNLDKMRELHDAGVTAFKVFLGPVSPDYRTLNLGVVREGLEIAASFGGLVGFHAEDYAIIHHEEERAARAGRTERIDFLRSRPVVAEKIATADVIELSRATGARVHICHVSHPEVAELIRQARNEGLSVSGETCTHYLVFDEDDVLERGMIFKCAPPLRDAVAREALWDYVVDGTLVCVASDHSPCAPREKDESEGALKAWGGISGIQSLMAVFFDQAVHRRGLCPSLVAARLSEGPARIFGLRGRKGSIRVGADADLVILDPDREWRITEDSLRYLNKISAFVGLEGRGMPETTLVRGRVVWSDGEAQAPLGYGELVKRHSPEEKIEH
ncbi:MAG: allantoinase AllB [Fretibacterium sp.]|nr:allantoinase AllB [Fretibacterium sp.]